MKEIFIDELDKLMIDLHPHKNFNELPILEQHRIAEMANDKVIDRLAAIADQGKERRKYG